MDLKTGPPTPAPTVNAAQEALAKASLLPLPSLAQKKPNIVFMLADDLGYGSLDTDDLNAAPFLSELKQKSVTLNKYYSQETCTPARAALLTGRLPIRYCVDLKTPPHKISYLPAFYYLPLPTI